MCTAGMLAVPIRMQYVSVNQHRQHLNIACSKCTLVVFSHRSSKSVAMIPARPCLLLTRLCTDGNIQGHK